MPTSSRAQEIADAEMGLVEADTLLRVVEQRAEAVDLLAQGGLPLAGRFQFVVDGATVMRHRGRPRRSRRPAGQSRAADALAERLGQLGIDDLGQAAEFLLDRLRLADQHLQNAIFGPLRVDEVMAEDLGLGLELAVDAAVALLHAAGIPGHVEVEQVPAMRLQVEAFAGGVGGNQDAHRVFGWGRR